MLHLFCLASGELGGGEREHWFCIPCNVATTLIDCCCFILPLRSWDSWKKRQFWKNPAVRKQFCSPTYELRCMAGHVCHLCIIAVIEHCCQFLCCKKQRDWESCWHQFLSTVIGGCFCCCIEANAQGARSEFLALFLNLYKPYLNVNFYFASGKKSGVLSFWSQDTNFLIMRQVLFLDESRLRFDRLHNYLFSFFFFPPSLRAPNQSKILDSQFSAPT